MDSTRQRRARPWSAARLDKIMEKYEPPTARFLRLRAERTAVQAQEPGQADRIVGSPSPTGHLVPGGPSPGDSLKTAQRGPARKANLSRPERSDGRSLSLWPSAAPADDLSSRGDR